MNTCPVCNSNKIRSGTSGSGDGIANFSFTCFDCDAIFTRTEITTYKNRKPNVKITHEIQYKNIKKVRKMKLEKINGL